MVVSNYIVARGHAPHCVNGIDKDHGHGNLLFCWIQKVGCTNFKKLLSPLKIHVRSALPERKGHPRDFYSAIMHNSSWHKAVFYREPLERFLSGYLDKCSKLIRVYCISVFGSKDATFDDAVRSLITQDPDKINEHFHSQVDFCGGLKDTLPLFDTVEILEPETSRDKAAMMLQRANVTPPNFDKIFPGKIRTKDGHQTHASKKIERYYNNTQHVGIVVNFFYEDYVLLDIPLPDFAVRALLELNRTQDEFRLPFDRLDQLLQRTNKKSKENGVQNQSFNQPGDIVTHSSNTNNVTIDRLVMNATKHVMTILIFYSSTCHSLCQ